MKFFEPYLTLWIDCHLSIGNHMTKSIYVDVIRMIMMPSCPYFIFIDASTSKHEDIFIVIGFSLEDKRGLSLGVDTSILHHAFISILLHYGLSLHIISQYLWLFSIILQGLLWRGGMPAAGILAGKGENIRDLFYATPKVLKLHGTS